MQFKAHYTLTSTVLVCLYIKHLRCLFAEWHVSIGHILSLFYVGPHLLLHYQLYVVIRVVSAVRVKHPASDINARLFDPAPGVIYNSKDCKQHLLK